MDLPLKRIPPLAGLRWLEFIITGSGSILRVLCVFYLRRLKVMRWIWSAMITGTGDGHGLQHYAFEDNDIQVIHS